MSHWPYAADELVFFDEKRDAEKKALTKKWYVRLFEHMQKSRMQYVERMIHNNTYTF